MLISLSNLAAIGKIQKNIWTQVRPVGPTNVNKRNDKMSPHLWKWCMFMRSWLNNEKVAWLEVRLSNRPNAKKTH